MIVDTRPIVERIMVRCNDCPKQVAVYVSCTRQLSAALTDIGWQLWGTTTQHYCPEHAS